MENREIYFLIVLLSLMLLPVGCSQGQVSEPNINVSVAQAQQMWQAKQAIIVDVRTEEEYRGGHVPGSLLIPLDQLGARIDEIPKEQKVLLICRSGNRSGQGTRYLRDKGYTNVYNITGGMNAWQGPIEK